MTIRMAYEMVMPYHLHMPSYFLETFTEYPCKVLVLQGFDGSYLPNILNVLNTGDYHGIEPWVYSDCLKKNMRQRIRSFQQKK